MFKNKKLKNHQMSEIRTSEIGTLFIAVLNKTKQCLTGCSTRIVDLSPRKGVLFLTMEEKQEDQIQIPLPLVKLGTQGLEVNLFSFFTFLIFLPVQLEQLHTLNALLKQQSMHVPQKICICSSDFQLSPTLHIIVSKHYYFSVFSFGSSFF